MKQIFLITSILTLFVILPIKVNAITDTNELEDKISNRKSPYPEQFINTIPGNTAKTFSHSSEKQIGDFISTTVQTFLTFGTENGKKITTFPNMVREGSMMLGLFEKEIQSGGKLLPLALQPELIWPQYKEGNDLSEQYASKFCAWFGSKTNTPSATEGKINTKMAQSEQLKNDYYFTLVGSHLFGALLGSTMSNGQTGVESLNFATPKQEYGEIDPKTNSYNLKKDNYSNIFSCGSESIKKKVPALKLNVHGELSEEDTGSSGLYIEAHKSELSVGDIIKKFIQCAQNASQCLQEFVNAYSKQTMTVITPGAPALFASVLGYKDPDKINTSSRANVQDIKDLQNSKGFVNAFFPQSLIDSAVQKQYDTSHGYTLTQTTSSMRASPQQDATGNTEIPHYGVQGVKQAIHLTTDCMLMPLGLQKSRNIDCTNTE